MPPASMITNGFVGADPRYIPDFNRMTGTNVRRHGADIIRTPTTSCKSMQSNNFPAGRQNSFKKIASGASHPLPTSIFSRQR